MWSEVLHEERYKQWAASVDSVRGSFRMLDIKQGLSARHIVINGCIEWPTLLPVRWTLAALRRTNTRFMAYSTLRKTTANP